MRTTLTTVEKKSKDESPFSSYLKSAESEANRMSIR
jgi:hypothetical protein